MAELTWQDPTEGLNEIIAALGVEILLAVNDADHVYRGYSRMLVRDGTRYGIAVFGGNCSSCRFVGLCRTKEQADRLVAHIASVIHWERTPRALHEWLAHDAGFTAVRSTLVSDVGARFREGALALLRALMADTPITEDSV